MAKNVETSIDLANWMGNLDESKRNTSINFIAIPGSHDSMTYGISRSSQISPDAEDIVKELAKYFKPFVKIIMYGWSVTQGKGVLKQLNMGIRYFDLRVATKERNPNFYFVHGMYGSDIYPALISIAKFLNDHVKESVILDFQHFYSFNDSDHQRLVDLLSKLFGGKLCPRPIDVRSVTLNWMMENNHQIIIIYRNSFARTEPFLWPSNLWPTPWPNTMNLTELMQYLKENLAKRPQNTGYVSQCILTPQTSTVVQNVCSGVKRKCAIPVSRTIIPWLQQQSPPVNVAIADFVELNNANFPLSLLGRNVFDFTKATGHSLQKATFYVQRLTSKDVAIELLDRNGFDSMVIPYKWLHSMYQRLAPKKVTIELLDRNGLDFMAIIYKCYILCLKPGT